jgi:hypothetical protein
MFSVERKVVPDEEGYRTVDKLDRSGADGFIDFPVPSQRDELKYQKKISDDLKNELDDRNPLSNPEHIEYIDPSESLHVDADAFRDIDLDRLDESDQRDLEELHEEPYSLDDEDIKTAIGQSDEVIQTRRGSI